MIDSRILFSKIMFRFPQSFNIIKFSKSELGFPKFEKEEFVFVFTDSMLFSILYFFMIFLEVKVLLESNIDCHIRILL